MSPRSTLFLALVVAIAGGLVWWIEVRGADERADAEDASKRVFRELEAEQVAWVELETRDGRQARLERTEQGGWRLVDPLRFPADGMAADGIASAVTELVSERIFEEHEDLDAYGLGGEPKVRFGSETQGFALRIGDKTPVGGNTYVAPEDGDPVYAVATWRTSALQKSLDELRDARVLDFDRESVTAIEARWPGASVRAERRDGDWRLVEPVETDADAEAVEGLLADLAFLRADAFVDDPPPDAELGLAEPAYELTLHRGEESEPARLVVGAGTDGATRAVRGRDGAVFRVSATRLEELPRSVDAWRFKELARFDVPAARRFEIVFHPAAGGEAVRIEGVRGEAGWTTEPEALAPGKAGALLTALSGLDADAVAADAMGEDELAALGLAPPRARIRVRGEGSGGEEAGEAPLLADVSLGVLRDGRVAARRAGRDEVFWVGEDVAEHVPVSLEAWRNRFVSNEADAGDTAASGGGAAEEAAEPGAAEDAGG